MIGGGGGADGLTACVAKPVHRANRRTMGRVALAVLMRVRQVGACGGEQEEDVGPDDGRQRSWPWWRPEAQIARKARGIGWPPPAPCGSSALSRGARDRRALSAAIWARQEVLRR